MYIQSASTLIFDFQPLELEVIVDHQVYGILLLQPEQTKTPAICWIWITDSMVQLHTYCANCWCYPLKRTVQVPMSSQMSWLQLLCHSRSHLLCFSCSKYTTFEIFVITMGGGREQEHLWILKMSEEETDGAILADMCFLSPSPFSKGSKGFEVLRASFFSLHLGRLFVFMKGPFLSVGVYWKAGSEDCKMLWRV